MKFGRARSLFPVSFSEPHDRCANKFLERAARSLAVTALFDDRDATESEEAMLTPGISMADWNWQRRYGLPEWVRFRMIRLAGGRRRYEEKMTRGRIDRKIPRLR